MAIDIYFSNRSLAANAHALCRAERHDVLALQQWVEDDTGGRRDERIVRLRAGQLAPVYAATDVNWPAAPTAEHYAACWVVAEYDAEGQLRADYTPPHLTRFLSRADFDERVRLARDTELTTAWNEWQALPGPANTRFATQADARCSDCLLKDLSWTNCSPRLCTAAGLVQLAAGLAFALDRPQREELARFRDPINELVRYYELKPHAATPHLADLRLRRAHDERVDEVHDEARWPDDHAYALPLLDALVMRTAAITVEEAAFLLPRLLVITYLLSQIVEEEDGARKRVAYHALSTFGTYTRCLRITQRFGLDMHLVA